MHAEMVLILMFVTIISQVVLIAWKKKHYKSYQVRKTDREREGVQIGIINYRYLFVYACLFDVFLKFT